VDVGTREHPTCTSCHDPHAAGAPTTGNLPTALAGVPGIRADGTAIDEITTESELCYSCHGDNPVATSAAITRLVFQPNVRLDFGPSNPSFHPVESIGVNPDVPSLRPPWTAGDTMTCGDCHNSPNASRFGGNGPDGPHGSPFSPILARRYDTHDPNPESAGAYALCYHCHDRDSILNDESFSEHDEHVRNEDAPCSVCHDPHGVAAGSASVSDHTHLINFDLSVVSPDPATGRLEFIDLGAFQGQCFLRCHGENHSPESYGRD
ncbi:MAG: hypothetical protein KDC38_12585, partial [Planctomycetes bacterium]|nr:hypothetical protein [Planctomycetota bacterium]